MRPRVLLHCMSAFLWLNVLTSVTALAQPRIGVDEVIDNVVIAEGRLRNIYVEHFVGRELVLNESGQYVDTPRTMEGSVIYDGMLGGKFIAEIKKESIPRRADPSTRVGESWTTKARSRSYDGASGRDVPRPLSDDKEITENPFRKTARITAVSPLSGAKNLQSMSDGSAATLGFFCGYVQFDNKKKTSLGVDLKKLLELKIKIVVSADNVDGLDLIKVSDPAGNAYWFDPARGFALLRAIAATPPNGGGVPASTLVVEELTKLNDTTWYATKGYWADPSTDGKPLRKWKFIVSKVTMSEKPPASFATPIPAGYLVDDMITGKVYTSAGTLGKLNERLDTIVDDAVKESGRIPQATAPVTVQPREQGAAEHFPADSANVTGYSLIIGVSVGVIVLVAIACWWRKRKASMPVVLLLFLCPTLSESAYGTELATRSVEDFVHSNCGVDCAYLVLSLYERNPSLKTLASEMGVSTDLSQQTSLGIIKRVCETAGLSAEGIKTANVSRFLQESSTDFVAVIRLDKSGGAGNEYHFMIVIRRVGQQCILIDASAEQSIVKCMPEDVGKHLERPTGEMLVVWDAIAETGSRPRLLHDTIEVPAFSPDASPITVRFHVKNTGDASFEIRDVKTSCGCVGSPEYTPQVLPGRVNVVDLKLDPKALPVGKGLRKVIIETSGGENVPLVATIEFNVAAVKIVSNSISAVPTTITLGRVSKSNVVGIIQKIHLTVPRNMNRNKESLRVLVECANSNVKIVQESLSEHDEEITILYAVSLDAEPRTSLIDEPITFRIWRLDTMTWDETKVVLSGTFY